MFGRFPPLTLLVPRCMQMGLGKTVQCVATIGYLSESLQMRYACVCVCVCVCVSVCTCYAVC